ncbi:FAD/NAD(P)-binding domain-containing protein [Dentipellis sp. KUC8613]|nr:FAD/NAD(P)-binding domain-containing protein [Dentipellis sp. KUC8613]
MASQESTHIRVPTPKFRVAICGGGPGGLALAVTLLRAADRAAPVAIDIYEAAPELATVGAGISVWPRTRALLEELGVMEGLRGEIGAGHEGDGRERRSLGFTFRKSDQPQASKNFFELQVPTDPLLLHRSALLEALKRGLNVPSASTCTVHTSSRLVSYTSAESGGVTLHFTGGATAHADVLVGADGVRSAVRQTMFSSHSPPVQPRWTGVVAYRSLVRKEDLERLAKGHQAGKRAMVVNNNHNAQHLVTYPISRGEDINFVGFYTVPGAYESKASYPGKWVRDVPVEDVKACYEGWEDEVQAVTKCVKKATAWGIHVMDDVPRCVDGPVAILGDAMHAMETHFGAGGGQAMEDAYILGRILAHPRTALYSQSGKVDVGTALKVYERVRFRFASSLVEKTRVVGKLYEFANGWEPEPDLAWAKRWGEEVTNLWKWQWDIALGKDWLAAEKMLLDEAGRTLEARL